MKLCPKCNNSPLPFVMVFMVSGITAFLTWLTLGLSITEFWPRAAASALAFLAVGGTLLHYVLACLKRHCRHDERYAHLAHRHRPSARPTQRPQAHRSGPSAPRLPQEQPGNLSVGPALSVPPRPGG